MAHLLTPKDVATELQVAESTAREYMRAAGAFYLGGSRRHLRCTREQLDAWIADRSPAHSRRVASPTKAARGIVARDRHGGRSGGRGESWLIQPSLPRQRLDGSPTSPIKPTLPRETLSEFERKSQALKPARSSR